MGDSSHSEHVPSKHVASSAGSDVLQGDEHQEDCSFQEFSSDLAEGNTDLLSDGLVSTRPTSALHGYERAPSSSPSPVAQRKTLSRRDSVNFTAFRGELDLEVLVDRLSLGDSPDSNEDAIGHGELANSRGYTTAELEHFLSDHASLRSNATQIAGSWSWSPAEIGRSNSRNAQRNRSTQEQTHSSHEIHSIESTRRSRKGRKRPPNEKRLEKDRMRMAAHVAKKRTENSDSFIGLPPQLRHAVSETTKDTMMLQEDITAPDESVVQLLKRIPETWNYPCPPGGNEDWQEQTMAQRTLVRRGKTKTWPQLAEIWADADGTLQPPLPTISEVSDNPI